EIYNLVPRPLRSLVYLIATVPLFWLTLFMYLGIAAFVVGVVLGINARHGLKGQTAEESILQMVKEKRKGLDPKWRMSPALAEASVVTSAFATAIQDLPGHPRLAKRIVTRLRLEVHCLDRRGLLQGENRIGATTIGKWVVFMERWPFAYHLTLKDPTFLQKLEGGDAKAYELLAADESLDGEELSAFLKRGKPLHIWAPKLIAYSP
ncbi:MAG: hypothetical protein LC623_09770, partial [Halobacteriales archaeon]|nr:hypothetical protein [Halobacteriales archaeon]